MDVQTWINEWMNQFVNHLPVGYAFGAGMVSTVNPCGFAMLPVYLSLYMGTDVTDFYEQSRVRRILKATWITTVVSAGFILLFGIIGGIISAGGSLLIGAMPWLAIFVGFALLLVGGWILLGNHISVGFIHQISNRIGDPKNISVKGFFLYGIAFGAASLSCTLPIFLVVVGGAITAGNFIAGLMQFLSYSLGMGAVLLVLTLGIALAKEGLIVGKFRIFLPHVQKISAILLILAGGDIVYYWFSNGELF